MENTISTLPRLQQPTVSPTRLAVLVLALAFVGGILVMRFADTEEKRELAYWQNKLNLIADSRNADINGWLDRHFRELGSMAANPSLQLYLTTLESAKGPQDVLQEDPAQKVFLRNLLLVTADRLGFLAAAPDALKSVHANVHRASGSGLALVDNMGKIIVSTEGLSVFDVFMAKKVEQAPKAQASLIDIFTTPSGETQIGFVLPVYAIQGEATAAQQIGKLVGVKTLATDFFGLLHHPGVTEKTFEILLVRKEGDSAIYLPSGPEATHDRLSPKFALDTADLDAAYALSNPGDFAIKRDRESHKVLMTSRKITGAPWVMLLHINRDQALSESDSERRSMVFIMLLALGAFIASIVAAWWYGTSKRAMLLSIQTGRLAAHSLAQEKLLRLVTDNQPAPIFIVDTKNIVRFANEKVAKLFNISAFDVVGKDLAALMGPAAAQEYIEANHSALAIGKSLARSPHRIGDEISGPIIRSEHIPLGHIPIDSLPFPSPGVLIVDQDVTEIVGERERRVRILHQLVGTLVRMVDERDPYAANHSASVALVAREIAQSLGLAPELVETAQTAGNLMNIGKIVVPSEILTKPAALAKDEMQVIRDSMQKSVVLLQGIEFDGPVVETLKQAGERFDGTGLLKLKGEEILITARVIAVANSFIGMISPRSYRAAINIEEAITLLLKNIDTQFDRRAVVALVNFVENKQGRQMLAELAIKKVG